MDEITIKVWFSESENGYMYDIFDTVDVDEDTESVDGGLCTTTMANAIDMATSQALQIIKAKS